MCNRDREKNAVGEAYKILNEVVFWFWAVQCVETLYCDEISKVDSCETGKKVKLAEEAGRPVSTED